MKVLRIGDSELKLIDKALKLQAEYTALGYKEDVDPQVIDYEIAHIRTTRKLIKDMQLQELCERCLSYFWDRFVDEGVDNPDVEYLVDEMGISERELKMLFMEAGYEEEY